MVPRLAWILLGTICFAGPGARAQELPPSVDPGRQQERIDQPPEPTAERPDVRVDPGQDVAPPDAESIRFVLTAIKIDGVTVYPQADLEGFWSELLSREISLADVYRIAARITVHYRNDGFVLSRALVPPQDVVGGRVRIRVVEGYLHDVVIEGGPPARPSMWNAWREKLLASRPLRGDVLERYLLLMNDLPGISARGVLRPSSEPGASDLVVVVAEASLSAYLDVNNRGTRFLGRYQWEAGLTLNSVLGLHEETEFRFANTFNNELNIASLTHVQRVGSEGTTVALQGSFVDTEPGVGLGRFDLDGESLLASVGVAHPVLRTRSRSLFATARFDYLNSETDALRTTIIEDRLRVLRLGGILDFVDRFDGVNLLGVELSRGLDVLDATTTGSDNLSRERGESAFTKVRARGSRLQRLAPHWTLLGEVEGQYAFDRLLAPEEFGYGGDDFGRGYDPSEFTGDHGIAVLLELRYGRPIASPWLDSFQLYVFADYGVLWNREDGREGGHRLSAASGGGGVRVNFTRWLSGRLELAVPLARDPVVDNDSGRRSPRLFFGLTARY